MDRLIIFKPDAVELGIHEDILEVMHHPVLTKLCRIPKPFWEQHYSHVKAEMGDRFDKMNNWLAGGNCCVTYLNNDNGVDWKRTVRENFTDEVKGFKNLIHVSDDGKADEEFKIVCKFMMSATE